MVANIDVLRLIIGKATGATLNIVMQAGGKTVITFLSQAGKEMLQVIEENGVRAFYYTKAGTQSVIDWANNPNIKLALSNGLEYKVQFGDVLNSNLEKAQIQIKQYLKDADGNIIKNEQGDALAIVGKEGSEVGADNAVGMVKASLSKQEVEDLFEAVVKNDPDFDYLPGSPEHKAQRWAQYKESKGEWDFDRLSNTYEANMNKAKLAHAKSDEYFKSNGYICPPQCREVTISVNGKNRRLDIGDESPDNLHGVEIKSYETGKVYASEDIRNEIDLDKILVQRGWKIEWVFLDCDLSNPLKDLLNDAGIDIKIIP